MTSQTPGSGAQPEGTSLPPPRPFGEANTLTLPRRRRHAPGQGSVVGLTVVPDAGGAVLRAEIMRVEATPLTATF
ncbi:MAG: hypothetical protein ACYC0T_10340 [Ramlibacter sp.]